MPVSGIWRTTLIVLAALVPGAAYVSVINDLTDRDDDLAAGKANRLAGRSSFFAAALIALTAGTGIVISYLWRHDAFLLTAYLGAWLAFSLYSLPPFRFKKRGILGVLCDASGAHLFPTLVAVILAFRAAGRPLSVPWLVAVSAWAFAHGLRGILWHQLSDVEHDRRSGVRTFAERAPRAAELLGTWVAFPVELIALAALLWLTGSAWPAAALAFYTGVTWLRVRRWRINPVIVTPRPRFLIVLREYYDVFLPVSILIASSMRHPHDWIVLAIHLVLFPSRTLQAVRELAQLGRELLHQR